MLCWHHFRTGRQGTTPYPSRIVVAEASTTLVNSSRSTFCSAAVRTAAVAACRFLIWVVPSQGVSAISRFRSRR